MLLFTLLIIGLGLYSLSQIPIGAVPDVTNNQVQVITTSQNLSTQDMEQFITYPVELEMANLPGVQEIRSVSKFGLSVVTIVFEDRMGTYLPRQLIAEKIKSASEKIPEGFGSPEMGPISTGLGEIYQYILDVEPGYKGRYTPQDLRTIQDWIVKRQLSGIPGVVEVNTWGGYLKQYEVALDSRKLSAMNISARQIFEALENNNSVSGGGYIEKVDQAYFVRGEGLIKSLTDIENIVVDNRDGIPVLIGDVAEVGFGNAMRFGAITGNGEGEKVLGQVMMLKDANSKKVIEAVKQRVEEISGSLPEGVYINPFLDRSDLIQRTTSTITENLLLGTLIVVFIVVLLLGNFRSGLVIASVIPLCLLFALSLMYFFGVDANLMSLGAIDFGIIIDGAVIIVEYIAFKIGFRQQELLGLNKKETSEMKDRIAAEGASKMMNSAVFGQLIILIVFIPILTLSGVEGKMFKPMALTFSFALIGAMLLCFTYVPVMASLLLKPSRETSKNISKRLLGFLGQLYEPIITGALRNKRMVLGGALLLLLVSGWLFSRMGGEFVPTLDEGDFVIQPVLKTGTSLSKTIELTTQIEQILLDEFPEVKQVVTRIGAAEVPTDPMSMEESDVIIQLADKKEWVSAGSKDELADLFKEALAVIPGMEVEFTQPIEMRFNELITGVRADIAIKVFGEDLSVLADKAEQIKSLVETVPGAADVVVEKIEGLPQMLVRFDRSKVARYGLNIEDLNEMISMGFAGKKLGSVFEGEKRFELVVRLTQANRQDISNLQNLYVDLPAGGKIPLQELAEITYQKGAAKISRDDTRRRVVVGINVRNRDLQSVVEDVQVLIGEHVEFPVGYTVSYGGQFENLQSAKSRLTFAVPIALLLIFILLFFAFRSLKEALLVYSAIPLAAVGGVLLLWIREMPFSISAGVGFIALFGIAVLNGIVLIEHFEELKKQGMDNMEKLVIQGAKDRLRAVLLTAAAAALGFLPMAVSTSAGAEVQRPLATVVIGGLITSTLLTLVVLPVLYTYINQRQPGIKVPKPLVTLFVILLTLPASSQVRTVGLQDLLELARENNARLQASFSRMKRAEALVGSGFSLDKTQVYYSYDENNVAVNGLPIRVFGISQDFSFPTVYGSQRRVRKAEQHLVTSSVRIEMMRLNKDLTLAFYDYQIAREKFLLLRELDSHYEKFSFAARRRFELGETNYLERITAQSKRRQAGLQLHEAERNLQHRHLDLRELVQSRDSFEIALLESLKMPLKPMLPEASPSLEYALGRVDLGRRNWQREKQGWLPDLSVEYFQGSNATLDGQLIGYQFGLKVPLLFSGNASRIRAARFEHEVALDEKIQEEIVVRAHYEGLLLELKQAEESLKYYEAEGMQLSRELIKTAEAAYRNGEIDYFQYIQSLENAYDIKIDYLEQLGLYNKTVVQLNHLTL